jgi:hypothetical protein
MFAFVAFVQLVWIPTQSGCQSQRGWFRRLPWCAVPALCATSAEPKERGHGERIVLIGIQDNVFVVLLDYSAGTWNVPGVLFAFTYLQK